MFITFPAKKCSHLPVFVKFICPYDHWKPTKPKGFVVHCHICNKNICNMTLYTLEFQALAIHVDVNIFALIWNYMLFSVHTKLWWTSHLHGLQTSTSLELSLPQKTTFCANLDLPRSITVHLEVIKVNKDSPPLPLDTVGEGEGGETFDLPKN